MEDKVSKVASLTCTVAENGELISYHKHTIESTRKLEQHDTRVAAFATRVVPWQGRCIVMTSLSLVLARILRR